MRPPLLVAAVLGLLAPALARAYHEDTHEQLTRAALAGVAGLDAAPPPLDGTALERFRVHLYGLLAAAPDFAGRYPTPAAFDAWAFKEYLSLNPQARVHGFDVAPPPAPTLRDLVAVASRHPDEDGRNQSRFSHDEQRRVIDDRYGHPVPDDPATLDMGGLRGLSSQGHAHYQLLPGPKSDDPAVLKRDPARFAMPKDAHTFAAAFAQRFFTLAALARRWDDPAAPSLAALFLGHALHYAQDVANQIHAVQVGIYDFFVDARLESYKEELRSLGGLLRARPAFRTIGIRIIENHHLLAENLFAKRLREVAAGRADAATAAATRAALAGGEAEYAGALAAALGPTPPDAAEQAALLLAERSAREGPEVYRLARRAALPALSRVGGAYTDADDPDRFVAATPAAQAARVELYALERRGLARGASASALLAGHLPRVAEPAARLAAGLHTDAAAMRADAARRRAAYASAPPSSESIDYWVPGGLVALVAVVTFAVQRRRRRRAARARKETTS